MQAIIYICTCNSQANLEINFMGTKENALFFEPYNLNGLQVSNRIVMAPMTRSRADNPAHTATELTALYYSQRATAGLIIAGGTFISPEAVGVINVPAIYSKEQVEGWKLTTDAVHKNR